MLRLRVPAPLLAAVVICSAVGSARAGETASHVASLPAERRPLATAADFRPDAASVVRHGPAYRYPQAGWIVLHIEGAPYERGFQHGTLLAAEI
ncbi:MAG TPA: hypothetical protein VGG64_28545, partial [Pirellulales bacterium]